MFLNVERQSYFVLDEVATVLWGYLVGETGTAPSAAALADEFGLSSARMRLELAAFAERCQEQALLRPANAAPERVDDIPPRPSPPARFRSLTALRCLHATRRGLRRRGFRHVYEHCERQPVAHPRTATTETLVRAFVAAERLFVLRRAPNDCLIRSLALYAFLRSNAVPAVHVIGVTRLPFLAHAWVEVEGCPVLDMPAQRFKPLSRIGLALG